MQVNPALLPGLTRYGGEEVRRQDLLASLALYTAAGGQKSAWLRATPEEWSPTDALVVSDAGNDGSDWLTEGNPNGQIQISMEDVKTPRPVKERRLKMTWPGIFVENGRLVAAVLSAGGMIWGPATIPVGVTQADALEELDLGLTGIKGIVPPEICHLKSLSVLRIYGSDIMGKFPTPLLMSDAIQEVHVDWRPTGGPRFMLDRTALSDQAWPAWVRTLDNAQDPSDILPKSETSNVRISYNTPKRLVELQVEKSEVLRSIKQEKNTVYGKTVIKERLNPLAKAFWFLSSLLILANLVTNLVVGFQFGNSGDTSWSTATFLFIGMYLLFAAAYTFRAFWTCSARSLAFTTMSLLGVAPLAISGMLCAQSKFKLEGRFNIDKPFSLQKFVSNIYAIEVVFHCAPLLLLQLYIAHELKYTEAPWWLWLSIGVSLGTVARAYFQYDIQTVYRSAEELLTETLDDESKRMKYREKLVEDWESHEGTRMDLMTKSFRITRGSPLHRVHTALRTEFDSQRQDWKRRSYLLHSFKELNRLLHLNRAVPTVSLFTALSIFTHSMELCALFFGGTLIVQEAGYYFLLITIESVVGVFFFLFVILIIEFSFLRRERESTIQPQGEHIVPPGKRGLLALKAAHKQEHLVDFTLLGAIYYSYLVAVTLAITSWFISLNPAVLLPRLFGKRARRLWGGLAVITYTTLLVLKYAFLSWYILRFMDASTWHTTLAVTFSLVSAVFVLLMPIVTSRASWRKSCVTSGVWCGSDRVKKGHARSEKLLDARIKY